MGKGMQGCAIFACLLGDGCGVGGRDGGLLLRGDLDLVCDILLGSLPLSLPLLVCLALLIMPFFLPSLPITAMSLSFSVSDGSA